MDLQWWVLVALAAVVGVILLAGTCSWISQRVGDMERAMAQWDGYLSAVGQGVASPSPAAPAPACLTPAPSHNIYMIAPASATGAPAPYIAYSTSQPEVTPIYPVLSEQPTATPSYPPRAPSASAISTQPPRESGRAELDAEAQEHTYQQLQQHLKNMANITHPER